MTAASDRHPFPLLCSPTYHGLRRNLGCGLCFAAEVPAEARTALEALVPAPLRFELIWSRDFLYAGTADRFDPGDRAALSDAIDVWLRASHALAPLAFVYTTDLPERPDYPPWAARSVALIPAVVLPWLTARWDGGGLAVGGSERHAAIVLDSFSYFLLTLYADATPTIDADLRARLVHLANVICDSDSGCGAELWRSELIAKLAP